MSEIYYDTGYFEFEHTNELNYKVMLLSLDHVVHTIKKGLLNK